MSKKTKRLLIYISMFFSGIALTASTILFLLKLDVEVKFWHILILLIILCVTLYSDTQDEEFKEIFRDDDDENKKDVL